ncbi:MAG: SHOCT domain-containing protein [Actinomycetota bacterium]|nr:SHOCT domain-containing protein [Actinomycetota bacterium]
MMWWDQGAGWAYAAISLGMIAFLALLVWAVFAIGRTDIRNGARLAGSDEAPTAGAERILAERFARGEIDADEYHGHIADLHPQHLSRTRS